MEVNRHLIPWMEVSRQDVCMLQSDPALWSEIMVGNVLRRQGATTCSPQDAQTLIKDYLRVLCENI